MDFYDFADTLCHLSTAIAKYLEAKKAREYCRQGHLPLPPEVLNTITDVLDIQVSQCEKKVVELATKLIVRPEEKPEKKKK